jgi:uncharacterized cupredoxin-like copper-binding protein
MLLAVGAAVVLAAAVSTVGLAAASGARHSGRRAPSGACAAPNLPGTVVDVHLMNMGGRMSMMSGAMGGMMAVAASRPTVPAGTVSFRVANVGSLVHELVILPLATGGGAGRRAVGTDNRVDETGSAGEASRSCGSGSGDGIAPGALGWVTLELPAGDYELLCNLPGHYAAGMHTTLHVV